MFYVFENICSFVDISAETAVLLSPETVNLLYAKADQVAWGMPTPFHVLGIIKKWQDLSSPE